MHDRGQPIHVGLVQNDRHVPQLTPSRRPAAPGFTQPVRSTGHALVDARTHAGQAELLVAVDVETTVLGTVTVVRPGTPYAEVSRDGEVEFRMLAVNPPARGRGVGEALVHAAIMRAREFGARRLAISNSKHMTTAHRLYQRLGFQRLPERDWRPVPGVEATAYAFSSNCRSRTLGAVGNMVLGCLESDHDPSWSSMTSLFDLTDGNRLRPVLGRVISLDERLCGEFPTRVREPQTAAKLHV
ncbi:GNAT family N-acetyltransferase [Saccharothrix sp. ALI-22-I]|uniref:GNAT family N-acetyltransferase n=1 Tax=Saccharothrix sp. ALI-22-I TaxID=1933778 RepID=UPI003082AF71